MRRTLEPDASAAEQERATRDVFVILMNTLLSQKQVRQTMKVLPKANFSRLVLTNTSHMHWRDPEAVFKAAGTEPVTLRRAEVIASLSDLNAEAQRVLRTLFLDKILYIPWSDFLSQFVRVVEETIKRIQTLRETNPRRLCLLVLQSGAVAKSNAWLTGFAWPQLSQVVDFVVSDNDALAAFLAVCQPGADYFKKARTYFGDRLAHLDAMLNTFEVDLIYVDDMAYSGNQAEVTLFQGGLSPAWAARCRVHLAVPYVATYATEVLTTAARLKNFRIDFAPSRVLVENYGKVVADIAPVMREIVEIPPWVRKVLNAVVREEHPAVVFAHKLADRYSIPLFLIVEEPLKVYPMAKIVEDHAPFYKSKAFAWTHADGTLERFTDINHPRFFAALQAHWEAANAPCERGCGRCRRCEAHARDQRLYTQ